MNNMPSFFSNLHPDIFVKISFLIILFLFIAFTIIILNQVRSLNKIFSLHKTTAAMLPSAMAVLYFFLAVSLFIIALVIL